MITTIITTIVVYAIADAAASLVALHVLRKHRHRIAAALRSYLGVSSTSPHEVISEHEEDFHAAEIERRRREYEAGEYEACEDCEESCH